MKIFAVRIFEFQIKNNSVSNMQV